MGGNHGRAELERNQPDQGDARPVVLTKIIFLVAKISGCFVLFCLTTSCFLLESPSIRDVTWTFVNKTEIPVTPFDDRRAFGIVRANSQTSFGYIQHDKDDRVTIRAYEFIPGEGNEFGWYDSELKKTTVGRTSDKLVYCRIFSSKEINFKAPKVVIEPLIRC